MKTTIKHLIESRNIKQSLLADSIGVKRQTVSQWCKGNTIPRNPEIIKKVADFFQTTPSYILYGDKDTAEHSIQMDDDYVLIPSLPDSDIEKPPVKLFKVSNEWLRLHAPYCNTRSLNIVTADDASMEPTIKNKSIVLIDTSVKKFNSDAVYLFRLNEKLFLKRIQRVSNGFRVLSDNGQLYHPFDIKDKDLKDVVVIGRACATGGFHEI